MRQIKFDKQYAYVNKNFSRIVCYELSGTDELLLGREVLPRKCRFCGSESHEMFSQQAHAIPRFIGNRVLKTLYECDKCNSFFSDLESNFSNFMALYHIFSHVNKKEYRNNSKSRVVAQQDGIDIYLVPGDKNLSVTLDRAGKTITVDGVRSYIPLYVYKVFVKMALSIMPEVEMHNFNFTTQWLMSNNVVIPNLYLSIRMYQGLEPFNGACMIYKRRDKVKDNVPCYLFGLMYNNFFFQICIPLCIQDMTLTGKVNMPYIPCHLDKKGVLYNEYWYNLSSSTKIMKEKISLTFDVGDWII